MKRKRDEDALDSPAQDTLTPKKTRTAPIGHNNEDGITLDDSEIVTPSKRARGRPPGSKNKQKDAPNGTAASSFPSSPNLELKGKRLFVTPTKLKEEAATNSTPSLVRNADRSARRKSARTLIDRTISGNLSGEDEADGEDSLARRIWNEDEGEEDDLIGELDEAIEPLPGEPTTPSKRGPGRPKTTRRKRTPTPPQDLSSHDQYFFENRPGGIKTSNNTLSSLSLLDHDEYFSLMREYADPHEPELAFLNSLHSRSFNQWQFELIESFNICLYGWGSKRNLVMQFAEWLHKTQNDLSLSSEGSSGGGTIIVVNGYTPTLTIRDILNTIASALLGSSSQPQKLGGQPTEILDSILSHLSGHPSSYPLTLIIHSIDASPLRRPTTQSLLARLASHKGVNLLATADTPSFPLLWDSSLREQYNFLCHDCTTFAPYTAEISVVDDVYELLGRSGRWVGGKEGVGFVLKSLPENARNLYRVLVGEQLAALEEGVDDGGGVEYRVLYQKAVEDFICSSEMAFRTLLKEFHDHQMVSSRKDVLGTEILWAPFRKEELEGVLEDLMG
ncbi:MAG: Origin recognition complex subunit 2 [Pycnora praestabilis]|nr:MAG: Origin recognition complex subunit 2 [Pycnora praestabilis]